MSSSLATPTTVLHRRAQRCQDGPVDHPVPMEIADITDALSLWQRLVSGALGRPVPPAVAVDAFRRLHRDGRHSTAYGGDRARHQRPCRRFRDMA
jgi:hypothetical protein